MSCLALSLSGVTKHFPLSNKQDFAALNDISFSVERGSKVAIVGPTGSGKSTLIRILTGILTPTTGEVKMLGLTPSKDRYLAAHKVGVLFGQRSQLWHHLSPMDSFVLLGAMYGLSSSLYKKRIEELSLLFGVEGLLQKTASSLSLDERMPCELLAALLHKPDILVLDEPLVNLSPQVRGKIKAALENLMIQEKTTLVFASSDRAQVSPLCKRVLLLEQGVLSD